MPPDRRGAHADHGQAQIGKELRSTILELVQNRGAGKTICPSEAPRRIAGRQEWRGLMELTREVGRELARKGLIVVTQKGSIVDADTARGPIRYSLPLKQDGD